MKNPIAELEKPDSLKFIDPTQADPADQEEKYYCLDPNCPDPSRQLYLKRSSKGKQYFSHGHRFDHRYSPGTLLRKLAIAHLKELAFFKTPAKTFFDKDKIIALDKSKTKLYPRQWGQKPEALLTGSGGQSYFVGLAITGPVSDRKAEYARERAIPLIEVDLEDFYETNKEECEEDVEFIEKHIRNLLVEAAPRQWTYLAGKEKIGGSAILVGALGALALAGYLLLKR